jgi:hypothetical protein
MFVPSVMGGHQAARRFAMVGTDWLAWDDIEARHEHVLADEKLRAFGSRLVLYACVGAAIQWDSRA